MKKLITLSIALTLLLTPTIALAKGGHGGGHGGHGGHRGGSVTNQLLFYSLYHPRHHYVPKEEKPEDLEKEDHEKFAHNIILIIGGIIIVVIIVAFFFVIFL